MTVSGTVDKILYQNADGWSIVRMKSDSGIIKLVGVMDGIREETNITADGVSEISEQYGPQFKVLSWSEDMPKNAEGIRKYLSDGQIGGIGPVIADRIVDKFGDETWDILNNHIDRLTEVQGIGEYRLAKIKEGWMENFYMNHIYAELAGLGISMSKAYAIYDRYGFECLDVVRNEPYRLIDDIDGIGFKIADSIALKAGIPFDSYMRLRSGIVYSLKNELDKNGHCYLDRETLVKMSAKNLEIDRLFVENALVQCVQDGTVILELDRYYFPLYYHTEFKVANHLDRLMDKFCMRIDPVFDENGIEYDDTQKRAITNALNSPVYYITGGPGTGKTTIVKAIIKSLGGRQILLAAPTGRAAKRLSEATGREAKTIHRLLEFGADGFRRDYQNPLEGDVLIVDECSMIDLLLMNSLLDAVPTSMRVIFVGDADQLPSVGPGTVLYDIIRSGKIPGIRLSHIFRQAEMSRITVNAHRIINGYMPDTNTPEGDYRYLEMGNDINKTANVVVELARRYFNAGRDVQVLTPQKNTVCGTNELNKRLQSVLNPNTKGVSFGQEYQLCKGDRVMQRKNNYSKGVFNGDIGYVAGIDRESNDLLIQFDGHENSIHYTKKEAAIEIMLAYAATVHKAQGSEYDVVIMPVITSHKFMLNKNLFYTAVTRAKKLCIIVGCYNVVGFTVHKNGATRNTTLTDRIVNAIV